MHDYNASLHAVDGAMTLLEQYRAELSDRRAATAFALTDLQAAVDRAVHRCERSLDEVWQQDNDPDYVRNTAQPLRDRLDALRDLQRRCTLTAAHLLDEWNSRCGECGRLAEAGFADAGRYLKKLSAGAGLPPAGGIRTVIVDSARHPQAAEHIRIAQNRGQSDVVTLDRSGAAGRRRESLAHKPVRDHFDRDEYPCALFAEGGAGADVAYIDGSDNRGAGSSLQWQTRTLPDGTRVRVRVI